MTRKEVIGDATLPGLSHYLVGADGEIRSTWAGGKPKVLKGGADKDGYRKFTLIDDDGERRYMRRCVLVCTAFHGNRPEGMTVRHLDGSRNNDAEWNLQWATHSDNCKDKLQHGTAQRGSRNGHSTIDEETARRIKAMLDRPTKEIAAEVGVKPYIVNNIRYGNSWGWL